MISVRIKEINVNVFMQCGHDDLAEQFSEFKEHMEMKWTELTSQMQSHGADLARFKVEIVAKMAAMQTAIDEAAEDVPEAVATAWNNLAPMAEELDALAPPVTPETPPEPDPL